MKIIEYNQLEEFIYENQSILHRNETIFLDRLGFKKKETPYDISFEKILCHVYIQKQYYL
jgi:hypothetical protein